MPVDFIILDATDGQWLHQEQRPKIQGGTSFLTPFVTCFAGTIRGITTNMGAFLLASRALTPGNKNTQ